MGLEIMLKQGFSLLGAGKLDECASLCAKVPRAHRNNSSFIFLRAELAVRCGEYGNAENMFQALLKASPQNPSYNLGYGRLLRVSGKTVNAEVHIKQALLQKPHFPEAQYELGMLLLSVDRAGEAVSSGEALVSAAPNIAEGWELLAAALQRSGRFSEALKRCEEGVACCPQQPRLRYALAQLRREACDFIGASEQYKHAGALGLQSPDLYQNHAEVLSDAGRQSEALSVMKKGVELHPQNALLHRLLARYHFEFGTSGDSVKTLWDAARRFKTNPTLWQTLLELLERLHRSDEVADALTEIPPEVTSASVPLQVHAAKNAFYVGRQREALQTFDDLVLSAPDDPDLLLNFAMTLLQAGDGSRAAAVCDQVLKNRPRDQLALAYLGVALRLTKDPREEFLCDYEAMVSISELPTPCDYSSRDAFFCELIDTLEALHGSALHPLEQTVRGGTQTNGFLFRHPDPVLRSLEAQLKVEVVRLIENFPVVPEHPFWPAKIISVRPENIEFSGAWSVRLSKEGFHTNHVHPTGWLSAVLYIALPAAEDDSASTEGFIQFGEPLKSLDLDMPPRLVVKPEVGRLIMFPSYMWHGTIPFNSDQNRVTIAFDIAPLP